MVLDMQEWSWAQDQVLGPGPPFLYPGPLEVTYGTTVSAEDHHTGYNQCPGPPFLYPGPSQIIYEATITAHDRYLHPG